MPANNLRQVRAILAAAPDEPFLLAGDFNAEPASPSMRLLEASGRFAGVFDGAPTFPAGRPRRRIDTVPAPDEGLAVVEERLLDVDLSEHEPVLVVLR